MNTDDETAAVSTPMPRMALWEIDKELAALMEYRQDRYDDAESPPDEEERKALDGEVAKYMEALPRKVDSVVGILRMWGSQLDAILGPKDENGTRKSGEVGRLKALAQSIQAQIDRLKEGCIQVLEAQPLPAKGSRKIVGASGSKLMLKANGGLAPLFITNEALLPPDCIKLEGWIRGDIWEKVAPMLPIDDGAGWSLKSRGSGTLIRAKLADNCGVCEGSGGFTERNPGRMSTEALQAGAAEEFVACVACGGTGKAAVPGAYIGQRGAHLEVK